MPKSSKVNECLDFEITFYERLLQEHPHFTDALIAVGEAYTRRGWYDKGLAVDLRLTQLKREDALAWYNLACSYSLLKRAGEALEALRLAIKFGYDDFAHLSQDPDLATLRRSPEFHHFLTGLTPHKSA